MRPVTLFLGATLLIAAAPPELEGYRLNDYRAPVPATVQGAEVAHLDEMRAIVADHQAVLVDVLPAPRRPPDMHDGMPWLPQPHRSLPGGVWWPDVGRGALAPPLVATFRQRLATVAKDDRLVVFFCLSECWMSWNAAKRAATWGYRVAWFPEGVDGWEAAGLPTEIVEPEPLDQF